MQPVNLVRRSITEYGPDPNTPGISIAHEVWKRVSGLLVAPVAGGPEDPGSQWFGDTQPPQAFRGLAANPVSSTVYKNGAYPTLSDATITSVGDPVAQLLAARMRRRPAIAVSA